MSSFGDWFSPIKNAAEVIFTDVHNLFGNGGFTQANLVKLGMDVEAGLEVDLTQANVAIQAIESGINQAIPVAEQAIADAQVVAAAYPAIEPFIVEMQAGLTAIQALSTVFSGTSVPTTNIPQGIVALSNLASTVAGWAEQAIQSIKNAPKASASFAELPDSFPKSEGIVPKKGPGKPAAPVKGDD